MTIEERFEETKGSIAKLLAELSPYDFTNTKAEGYDAKLYLIDEAIDKELIYLRSRLEAYHSSSKEAKTYGFDKLVKHFNPAMPVSRFGVYAQRKWEQVSDPEKVRKRLDARFAIYKNVEKKRLEERIAKGSYSEQETDSIRRELDASITEAAKRLEEVRDGFDSLDVRISARGDRYGTISFRNPEQKQFTRHISKEMPNALYYVASKERPDNELARYLSDAQNVFGDVYSAPLTPERVERRLKAALKEKQKKSKVKG